MSSYIHIYSDFVFKDCLVSPINGYSCKKINTQNIKQFGFNSIEALLEAYPDFPLVCEESQQTRKNIIRKPNNRGINKERSTKIKDTYLKKYLNTPFDQLGMENRRRRVFEEQRYCCNNCGLHEWQGYKISLELEHKDGNRNNNCRENLEGLCPNCHSITTTWRGRNKSKSMREPIADEFLKECLDSSTNIRQGLIKAGLTPKGDNYKRAKKLKNLSAGRGSNPRPPD